MHVSLNELLQMSSLLSVAHCFPFRTSELQERLSIAQEQLRQAETDLEELQGEKSAKYRELKKREETIKGTCTHLQYNVIHIHCMCM